MSHRRSGVPLLAALALLAGSNLRAQEPAKTPAVEPGAPKIVSDLAARYRLVERYSNPLEKAPPGSVGQFQVAFRETTTYDDPKATEPRVVQAIFSERPVDVSPVDERIVTDSIRHYTSVTITPDPWKDRKDRRPLEDLTIWYREVTGEAPLVLVLSPDRLLREEEYKFAINYAFVKNFAFLLPEQPVRVGEAWKVSPAGTVALTNDVLRGGTLTAKLTEVRVYPKDPKTHVAVITVSGKLVTGDLDVSDTTVSARIEFAFVPAGQGDGIIDAPGAVDKVRRSQVSVLRVPGLTKAPTKKSELSLDRRRPGNDPPLTIPKTAPQPTPENSWLTFVESKGRYQLRHPQGFQPEYHANRPNQPNTIDLEYSHGDEAPPDIVRMTYVDKPQGRPEDSFKILVDEWRKQGVDVQLGLSEKLPDADWPGLSVHHMEAALTETDPKTRRPTRRYFDAYVIGFPRNVSLFIVATTYQDQPETFRSQVRTMLKTLKLGAPKGP